ncbi:hypothetical protein ACFE04_009444 [Oxalis oulophora]
MAIAATVRVVGPTISTLTSSSSSSFKRITCSTTSPNPKPKLQQFNIKFAPPKPKPHGGGLHQNNFLDTTGNQVFIPWIVRGEDGNLKLQNHPPARLIHELAAAETKKKKIKETTKPVVPTSEPKYSKAARRFYNENFRESTEQRLSKLLAAAGVASRRASEELIFAGKVTVNGSVCNTPQTKVDPRRDSIYVNGNRLPKKLPPKVYLALNKPKGYICSSGEKESKSVMSLFDDYMKSWDRKNDGQPKPRLFTVGRLDVATTGLIIVTNDGDFAQQLSHPSSKSTKEFRMNNSVDDVIVHFCALFYAIFVLVQALSLRLVFPLVVNCRYIAAVDGAVSKKNLLAISEGTFVDGVHCVPDSVELLPKQQDIPRPRLRIVVHEGRNHEVRELVKHAGLEIHSLKRVRIGGYRLPADLGLGKHVELKQSDLKLMGWTD